MATRMWCVLLAMVLMAPGWAQWVDVGSNAGGRDEPVLTSTGRGTVYADPDSVRVILGIETQHADVNAARRENEARTRQVFAALGKLNVPDLKVKSLGAAVQIIEEWPNRNILPTIIAYRMRNQVTVLAQGKREDLGGYAQQVVDTALANGANHLSDVIFFLTDSRAAEREAMKLAVQDASANLDTLAESLGVKIRNYGILESTPTRQYSYRWSSWWGGGDWSGMRQVAIPSDLGSSTMVAGQLEVTVTARLAACYVGPLGTIGSARPATGGGY